MTLRETAGDDERGSTLPTVRALLAPQARPAASVVAALWVLGALLGLVWQYWSPPGPAGFVLAPRQIQPDETEAFVAGDGRYAVLVVATGLVAGLLVWFARLARGSVAVLALAVGGLGGATLTEFVGHWSGGGTASGRVDSVIAHLPLSLHMSGLRYVEAAAALLAYGLCVSFAADDDLGRPDPVRAAARDTPRDAGAA
jgi:hypothetical protein